MKILITGSNGMLAKAVINKFKNNNELILTDINELDITNQNLVLNFVQRIKPDIIINCAAYTAVDNAETDSLLAKKINSDGPRNLAIACNINNIILVHISTDYVFEGNLDIEKCYLETDTPSPINIYGLTKLNGENEIIKNCNRYYIFRTAWLYGDGKNFVRTMIKFGKEKEYINVVSDQYGSPTYTEDLADIIYQSINKKIDYGIYHTTNQGFTTWYDFAKEIFYLSNINCKVNAVSSEEFITRAKRPKNSKLSKNKLLSKGIIIPLYKDALKRYLKKEGEIKCIKEKE